ncbi:hypothetical protein [Nostoc sp. FACHB-280]|uniref:hypothetical protein n=1 Tax=Nostoc sp. FACHB-280 TaxID=2692839 RepID=UPI00168B7386|nr:hypothetical protein [Nostoc sp. FACHB-280]MBD2494093.1 hypothetical protein [Nostoc sp. FACHB-280]
MKPKLLNFLKVCLLTLVVLSPALGVISVVWQEHLDFMATKHLLYVVKDSQQLITDANKTIINVVLWLMFFAPIGFGLGIVLYDRYLIYRAAVLQRQVEMLERIWQRSPYPEEIIL